MDFSHEKEQHEAIHDMLDKILERIRSAKVEQSKFNVDEMRTLMVNFREPLVSTLHAGPTLFCHELC